MKTERKKSARIALFFVSCGLYVTFFVFFLLFGKGLQIILPGLLLTGFFVVFFITEKIPFIAKRPVVKAIVYIAVVFAAALMI